MDIHTVREKLRSQSIYDIPLRVTYYARVSSDSDEQLNSLGNQIQYYEDYIKKSKAWIFVPGYVDEGLSGISTKHRENFNKMVSDSAKNAFDLVVTKEISRFARNTLDSIQYTRKLLDNGVGVLFQNDNILTLDEDSELRLSIMSSIAQDELRKLSSRVRFGQQQAIKNGVVLGNSRIFGYRKQNKRLVIDEPQAIMVRELFELYATGNYSLKQLEKLFWEKGYRNMNGKKICHSTLSNVIANPKYKGYYVGNKVKIINMFTKKQKFLPEEDWVMFRDDSGVIVPAIISEELWEQANEVLTKRSNDVKNRKGVCNHPNLLTGKIYCSYCGKPYYRKASRDRMGRINSNWVCSGRTHIETEKCPSFTLYEDILKSCIFEEFKKAFRAEDDMIEQYMLDYAEMVSDESFGRQIDTYVYYLEKTNKKRERLLELLLAETISPGEYKSMYSKCSEETAAYEKTISELKKKQAIGEDLSTRLEMMKLILTEATSDYSHGAINKELVDLIVEQIYVTPLDEDIAKLDITLTNGEICQRTITRRHKRRKSDSVISINENTSESA